MKFKFIALFLAVSAYGLAQLVAPNDLGVSMGHIHLHVKDTDVQKKFWVELLGGEETKVGNFLVVKMPGAVVFLQKGDSTGGSDGSVVNHVAVKVRDLNAVLAKMEAAHITIISKTPPQAMLMAPDDVKVELTEDTSLTQPLVYHHIHFYTPDVDGMKKWYVSAFGAVPGKRGRFEAADLPGVNLTFAPAPGAVVPTKGRSLDHIGFEVRNLEAFTKKMEASGTKFDIPYRKVPALGVAIAFFTDPWGTLIELTEGLDKL